MTSGGDRLASQPPERAIPLLVDRYGDRLYALALRMCDSPQAAEDLVQETFLRAFRGWDRFRGEAEPSTWLYTIATRLCRRMQRRRAGEPRRLESLESLLPAPGEDVPDLSLPDALEEQARREVREVVEGAIAELPFRFRLPFVLKELADLSLAEIAAILGIREATAKTRVHRARLRLRRAVAERLPRRPAPPPDHPRQVCLDLLEAKQEALDRGVPFPVPSVELCARCRALFATLDLAGDVCTRLAREPGLPEPVRELIRERATGAG